MRKSHPGKLSPRRSPNMVAPSLRLSARLRQGKRWLRVGCWLIRAVLSTTSSRANAAQPGAEPDQPSTAANATLFRLDRSWLYVDESQIPAPWQTLALSRVTYTSVGTRPTRPFAAALGTPGDVLELGGEVGVLPHLSVQATVLAGDVPGQTSAGAIAGVKVSILPNDFDRTHAVVSAGYLREMSGASGAWVRFTFSQDIDRLRLGSTIHVEHVIASGRDPVDVMVMAGAHVRVVDHLRVGAEYVGEDLEESGQAESEGGVRHFVGPSASLSWLDDRMTLTAGSAFGLSSISPRLVGRLGLAFAF